APAIHVYVKVPSGGTRSPCLKPPVTLTLSHAAFSLGSIACVESGGVNGYAPSEVGANANPCVCRLCVRCSTGRGTKNGNGNLTMSPRPSLATNSDCGPVRARCASAG